MQDQKKPSKHLFSRFQLKGYFALALSALSIAVYLIWNIPILAYATIIFFISWFILNRKRFIADYDYEYEGDGPWKASLVVSAIMIIMISILTLLLIK